MHSLGLSSRIRARLSIGEADRDRRASCLFYTKGARPPEAFRANCLRDKKMERTALHLFLARPGTKSWAARSRPSRFGHFFSRFAWLILTSAFAFRLAM